MKPDAATVQQEHDRVRPRVERTFDETGDLGAMHLADGAAHEAAFLSGDQDRTSPDAGFADDDAVVECGRHAEYGEMRAHMSAFRAAEFAKGTGVEQPGEATPCAGFEKGK